MGLSGWFDILIANILIRGYLLPAITNFRNLSNKTLMIVSIDFPHHGKQGEINTASVITRFFIHCSINYVDRGIPVKDCRDGGGCSGCCMNKLNWVNV